MFSKTTGNIAKIMKNKRKKHARKVSVCKTSHKICFLPLTELTAAFSDHPGDRFPLSSPMMCFSSAHRSYILHYLEVTFVNEACKLIYIISCFPVEGARAPENHKC